MRALPLREATLAHHAARVAVPTYDRRTLTPSVVHISVGAFHRSHQAVYFDDLAQRRVSSDWGLVGVGLRRPGMRDALAGQDGLYTLLERGVADRARVIGIITRYLFAPEEGAAVVAALADRRTRLVTLTVTGAGYAVDTASGAFRPDDPGIAADLATPGCPGTAVGLLVAALAWRRRTGAGPFTVLSCDNVPGNGRIARAALVGYAGLRDPDLAEWIAREVAFPSSMVDRITPHTTDADRSLLADRFGVEDRWPVVTEPFSQWVVEDDFCAGRPPLEAVGVHVVPDVAPYALMKTRLLNASHCALGHLGVVAGVGTTHAAMREPVFAETIRRMMDEEVAPLLPPVPGVDLAAYRASLLARLANPSIGDPLTRLCRAGSAKVPAHVLASVREARRAGRRHDLLTLAVAGFCRSLEGTDEHGSPLVVDEPMAPLLRPLARRAAADPAGLVSVREVFGDLGADQGFVRDLGAALRAIASRGVRGALADALARTPEAATRRGGRRRRDAGRSVDAVGRA
ncbi:MAG TPA: mannitol dehydrogenase family protein [Miltoncostaeaceae bacterium]|nr:mannitol dehydrogenase family protein [Miltoncostaeaceae bacterium]